jgi:hypothetical protein
MLIKTPLTKNPTYLNHKNHYLGQHNSTRIKLKNRKQSYISESGKQHYNIFVKILVLQSQSTCSWIQTWCPCKHVVRMTVVPLLALGWVHTCNITAYRNTVSWQCGRDSCNVTLHIHTYSGRNRIIPLMRWPNTDRTPNKPVTLPCNQLLIRYAVTSPVQTVTIRCHDTR